MVSRILRFWSFSIPLLSLVFFTPRISVLLSSSFLPFTRVELTKERNYSTIACPQKALEVRLKSTGRSSSSASNLPILFMKAFKDHGLQRVPSLRNECVFHFKKKTCPITFFGSFVKIRHEYNKAFKNINHALPKNIMPKIWGKRKMSLYMPLIIAFICINYAFI